jgi:hypothetical protein
VTSAEERALLTDFFLGPPDDGVALSTDVARTPNHRANNADNSVLAALWKAVDQNADASRLAGEEFLAAVGSPEGPWVSALPDELVIRLDELTDDSFSEAADRWARSKQLSYHRVSWLDLIEPLKTLKTLASDARSAEQKLFLRMVCRRRSPARPIAKSASGRDFAAKANLPDWQLCCSPLSKEDRQKATQFQ